MEQVVLIADSCLAEEVAKRPFVAKRDPVLLVHAVLLVASQAEAGILGHAVGLVSRSNGQVELLVIAELRVEACEQKVLLERSNATACAGLETLSAIEGTAAEQNEAMGEFSYV